MHVQEIDVAAALRARAAEFDAVLLDVDNGSDALTTSTNGWLYGDRGIDTIRASLTLDGVLGMWLASDDPKFARRLRQHGFTVAVEHVRGRGRKRGPRHSVLIAYQSVGP